MNNKVISDQPKKSPLLILAAILLLGGIIYFGNLAYKKWIVDPNKETIQSARVIQQQFILNQPDVINMNWLRTLNPLVKNVEGRVIWSNNLQKGVMEFVGLPEIASNQNYQLWIYDLIGKDTKPVFSTQFKQVIPKTYLIPFSSKIHINSPFKFELMLSTEGDETSQPLFLAQP